MSILLAARYLQRAATKVSLKMKCLLMWHTNMFKQYIFFLLPELSANPLANSGIELGAFDGMTALYIRIAEARLTAVPKGNLI